MNLKYFSDLLEDLKLNHEVYEGTWHKNRGFHSKFKSYYKHQLANFREDSEEPNLITTLFKDTKEKLGPSLAEVGENMIKSTTLEKLEGKINLDE